MTTHLLKKSTITDERLQWLKENYTATDSLNAEAYAKYLHEDIEVQMGNKPGTKGKQNAIEGIKELWKSIKTMNHHFINVLGTNNQIVLEAIIDYTRQDDKIVTVPAVTILELTEENLITSARVFIDLSPVINE
ncbi:MAG: hypothetical protein H7Y86_14580 [Rhizobacter sp.]|nr:hypothetical protein [Ferruginibacter sp.]